MEEGIEAGTIELISDSKLLLFGGRSDIGDSNIVYSIDLLYNSIEESGFMSNNKCLHKIYRPKTKY